jgi:cell wall assembly regulator SMI1
MKTIWDRVHTWLTAHAPVVLDSLAPPATEAQIRAAENALDVTLPDDVKASYRIHNGQRVVSGQYGKPALLYGGWDLYSLAEVVSQWKCWKDLSDRGTFAGGGSRPTGPIRTDWWHPGWIPLTGNDGGDHHCADMAPSQGGHPGQVISMWHDDP